MLIGEVARAVGLSASAIRYYEARGIVPSPEERTPGGYRSYSHDDLELLRFVQNLRTLRLPLEDIREMVSLRTGGHAPCGLVREALAREASLIEQQILDLRRIRRELVRLKGEADRIVDKWPTRCVCDLLDADARRAHEGIGVEVTLQYFEGCPYWQVTESHLQQLGVTPRYQLIETIEAAVESGFLGSPTVLINGIDPFLDPDSEVGLACRVYRTPDGSAGSPTIEQLRKAISSARSLN